MNIEIKEDYIKKGLTGNELLVYAFLKTCVEENGNCPYAKEEIADQLNISRRNIWRIMDSLKKAGHVVEVKIYRFP